MSSQNTKAGSTASLNKKLHGHEDELGADQEHSPELLDHPSYIQLQKQLTETEEKANDNWDRLVRLQAEMDNMKRRVERDVENAHKYALEKFTLELLPVVDGLELAIAAHANEESGGGSLLDGVKLTLKMLHNAFEKFGIEQVNPETQPFNPEFHQAVSTQDDASVKPGTVLKVLQKGYLLNGRLMRPALVVVAKAA